MRISALWLAFAVVFGATAFAVTGQSAQTVENGLLRVTFDDSTQNFSIYHKASKRVFVDGGMFTNGVGGQAAMAAVKHPEFGDGQVLTITYPDQRVNRIAVYANTPFVLFSPTLCNGSAQDFATNRVNTFRARVLTGWSPDQLRVSNPDSSSLASPGGNGYHAFVAIAHWMMPAGVVAGWVTQNRASGVIFTPTEGTNTYMCPRLDFGALRIRPGVSLETETFAIGWFDDARVGLENYADLIKQAYRITLPLRPPSGLCTWYMGNTYGMYSFKEAYLASLCDVAARELGPFGFDFLLIDDGWQKGVSYNVGPAKQFLNENRQVFPSGMKAVADGMKAHGLMPAIWYMPFAGEAQDPYFKTNQDWFVKRASTGQPYETYWGGTCLDMTQAGARDYARRVADQLVDTWGYKVLKMDGLYTGLGTEKDGGSLETFGDGLLSDPYKSNVDAYRDGLRLVRDAAGADVFLLGCMIAQNLRSFSAAFGLVDAMRIGDDSGARISAGAVAGSRLWFLNGRVWWNDPDCVSVNTERAPTLENARRDASWPAIAGQLFYAGDWLPGLSAERIEVLKRCMPAHGLVTARPLDVLRTITAREWRLTDTRYNMRRDVIAFFNWDGGAQNFSATPDYLGLPTASQYVGFNYWSNTFLNPFSGKLSVRVDGGACAILAIRPATNVPLLISTSRHVTQGIVDVSNETWNAGTRTLSGVSQVVGNDPYELRIVVPTNGVWNLGGVTLSVADVQAGVTAVAFADGTNLRVRLNSAASRAVTWRVNFSSTSVPLSMHPLFADGMVLQRDAEVPVWGWANAGQTVTVQFAGQAKTATADAKGKWMVKLSSMTASANPCAMTITASGGRQIVINNIVIGDVWLCSGQSNMEVTVGDSLNPTQEMQNARYPLIRVVSIGVMNPNATTPQEKPNVNGGRWVAAVSNDVLGLTAVGYFFGRGVYEKINIPVGLICAARGGTPAESWMSTNALRADPYLAWTVDLDYPDRSLPAGNFNAMIYPLLPYALKGAIWYQGEDNLFRGWLYRRTLSALIAEWRRLWNVTDPENFPFGIVCLAGQGYGFDWADQSIWGDARESQTVVARQPGNGLAVALDASVADPDIHPKNKQLIGARLSYWALNQVYGQANVEYTGPVYSSYTVEGNKIRLSFNPLGGGLVSSNGPPTMFAIAGADAQFTWATAVIDGNTIVVSAPTVANPVAVRYAWSNGARTGNGQQVANVYGRNGLPLATFRTDNWKLNSACDVVYANVVAPGATRSAFYSNSVASATALDAPILGYEKVSGTIPAGLSLSSAGWLTGTPTATNGTYVFQVRATAESGANRTANIIVAVQSPGETGWTVGYDGNGATGGTVPGFQLKTANVPITLSANSGTSRLVRPGYSYEGWNTAPDGSGTPYAAGATYTNNANLLVYANWRVVPVTCSNTNLPDATVGVPYTGTVALASAGGVGIQYWNWSGSVPGVTIEFPSGRIFGTPTSAGTYHPVVKASAGNGQVKDITFVMTVLPQGPPTYTVTYNANGAAGGTVPASQTKTNDVVLVLRGNTGNLVKSGSTFLCWNTVTNAAGVSYAAGGAYTNNLPVTLYAKWSRSNGVNYASFIYAYAPYNLGQMDPQLVGWPLSVAEINYIGAKNAGGRWPGYENGGTMPVFDMVPMTPICGGQGGYAEDLELTCKLLLETNLVDILLVGDSITAAWEGYSGGKPFIAQWTNNFGGYSTINLGKPGENTAGTLWRMDHTPFDHLKQAPRLCILQIGHNDMYWRYQGVGAEAIAQGIVACARNLRHRFPETPLILVNVFPMKGIENTTEPFRHGLVYAHDRINQLNLSAGDPLITVLDIWSDLLQADGTLNTALFADDVHLNAAGYTLWAGKLKPLVDAVMTKYTLDVKSGRGTPNPAAGNYAYGSNSFVQCSVAGSPVLFGGTQYVCTGWVGTGSVGNGTGTNASFFISADSTLTWVWQTNYWVALNVE